MAAIHDYIINGDLLQGTDQYLLLAYVDNMGWILNAATTTSSKTVSLSFHFTDFKNN